MDDSLHLLFPLGSSLLFVIGAMLAKQATSRGASPYTATALANFFLAVCWGAIGLVRGEGLPLAAWPPAVTIALAFVGGQLGTYLAFQLGDVSLATPVFGVKIILVAAISSLLAGRPVEPRLWVASLLATIGIAVIHADAGGSAGGRSRRRAVLAIILALLAATSLSLFDVGLQHYGREYGAEAFLTTMFVFTGVLSLSLLPWADSPLHLRAIRAGWPLVVSAVLMAAQAMSISYALGRYGDATRVNIVYSLRGLWSVALAWLLVRLAASPEDNHSPRTLAIRLLGAVLLTAAVIVALG
jgi:drug/metabolite transporter (DMT)-like permease